MKQMRSWSAAVVLFVFASGGAAAQQKLQEIQGYAEWRKGALLIVDGQRVIADAQTEVKGHKRLADIPLGSEASVKGLRQGDGSLLARRVEIRSNGVALFEEDAIGAANELEEKWLEDGRIVDEDSPQAEEIGDVVSRGRLVDRARRITRRLVPGYLDPDAYRVYVVENDDWNAFAMANGAIWVFSGLLADFDDAELAIVLGHELAHVTHEHMRRSMKHSLWIELLAAGVDALTKSKVAETAAGAVFLAWGNGYGRDLEDQADRVGVRYAYEAGFDPTVAPRVWLKFEEKYGGEPRILNFFFSQHSTAAARRRNLDEQIAWNYRTGLDAPVFAGGPVTAPRKPVARVRPYGSSRSRSLAAGVAPGASNEMRLEPGMTPE